MKKFNLPKYFKASSVVAEVIGLEVSVKFLDFEGNILLDYTTRKGDFMWLSSLESKVSQYSNRSYAHYITEYICKQLNK